MVHRFEETEDGILCLVDKNLVFEGRAIPGNEISGLIDYGSNGLRSEHH